MNWKSWPYWVKGVFLTLTFDVLLAITLLEPFVRFDTLQGGSVLFVLYPLLILFSMSGYGFGTTPDWAQGGDFLVWASISNLLFYFLMGAFVGWSYGKIKNWKSTKKPWIIGGIIGLVWASLEFGTLQGIALGATIGIAIGHLYGKFKNRKQII